MSALKAALAPTRRAGIALMVTDRGFVAVDAHLRLPFLLPERVAGSMEADHQAGRVKESDLRSPFATHRTRGQR